MASRAILLLCSASLLVACDAARFGVSSPQPTEAESLQVRGIRGKVLDMNGKPAGGVAVHGTLISNNSASLISNNSGGLISNNSASLISNGSGLYRIQSGGFETKTNPDGTFAFNVSDDQVLTLEAIQRENVKAIKLGAVSSTDPVTLQLAPTGHITGKVIPADPAVTDLLNIDVFIPGTSYVAKTDASGNFTLSNVPEGRFSLVADHVNLGRAILQGVTVTSNKTLTTPNLELSTHTPVLSSVEPANGAPGMLITLKGDHFGLSSGKRPDVFFNGLTAQIVSATDKELKVTVPLGALSGTVRVAVSGLESATRPFKVLSALSLFPDYRQDASNPTAQPPTSDVIAIGASRSYRVRAFDTEGALVPSPAVTWSMLGNMGAGFSNGTLTPVIPGQMAIAAVSGSLSSAPLSIEVVSRVIDVLGLPTRIAPLSPFNPNADASKRSPVPDAIQLSPLVQLDGSMEVRSLPFLYKVEANAPLTVTANGLVKVLENAPDGNYKVEVIPVADPAQHRELTIPVLQQGDVSFIIR
jgi:hypothetical protein